MDKPEALITEEQWMELQKRISADPRRFLGDSPVDKYGVTRLLNDMGELLRYLDGIPQPDSGHPLRIFNQQKEIIKAWQGGTESVASVEGFPLPFRVHVLEVTSYLHFKKWKEWCAAYIVSGRGKLAWSGHLLDFEPRSRWFIPAGIRSMEWINTAEEPLELVMFLTQ